MFCTSMTVIFRGSNAAASLKRRIPQIINDGLREIFRGSNAAASLKLLEFDVDGALKDLRSSAAVMPQPH